MGLRIVGHDWATKSCPLYSWGSANVCFPSSIYWLCSLEYQMTCKVFKLGFCCCCCFATSCGMWDLSSPTRAWTRLWKRQVSTTGPRGTSLRYSYILGSVWSEGNHYQNCLYSWPLNNMGLNCLGSLTVGFFSIINTTSTTRYGLVECTDMQPLIQRNHVYGGPTTVYMRIFDCRVLVTLTPQLFRAHW